MKTGARKWVTLTDGINQFTQIHLLIWTHSKVFSPTPSLGLFSTLVFWSLFLFVCYFLLYNKVDLLYVYICSQNDLTSLLDFGTRLVEPLVEQ